MPIAPAAPLDPYAFQTNDDVRQSIDICEYKCSGATKLWHASTGTGTGDDGGMSFSDFLDIINPLQHLPVISTIYRAITGDEPGLVSQLVGGALYGGPIGFLAAGLNAAFEGTTGESDGQMLASAANDLFGTGDDATPATAVAEAAAPAAAAPAAPQVAAIPPAPAPAADLGTVSSLAAPVGHPAQPATRPLAAFTTSRAFPAFAADLRAFPARAGPPAAAQGAAAEDPESRRIAASVDAQRRAQLGLILANANGAAPASSSALSPSAPATAALPEMPADGTNNPYLPIASGSAITPAAMQAALERYRHAIQSYAPPAAD